jgi:hypothetical protein
MSKFEGRPDDLRISFRGAGMGLGDGLGMAYAGGGLVLCRNEIDLTDDDNLDAGSTNTNTWGSLSTLQFSEYIFMYAFYAVKGFTGGSGAMTVSLGVSPGTSNDLVLASSIPANSGSNTIVRGLLENNQGTRLTTGTVWRYSHESDPALLRIAIDGTGFTGTCTGGKVIAVVGVLPLDGYIV